MKFGRNNTNDELELIIVRLSRDTKFVFIDTVTLLVFTICLPIFRRPPA